MSRAIGSGIVLNLLLAGCRGWFFRTTFGNASHRLWLLIMSCVSSTILALFPFFSTLPGASFLVYTTYSTATVLHSFLLLASIILVASSTYSLIGQFPSFFSRRQLITFLIVISLILGVRFFGFASTIGIRLLVAGIEERIKTSTNLALYDRFSYLHSDIIFFGLLSALGFALVENIVYLRTSDIISVASAISIIFKRTLTSWVMHLCYTGMIALGISRSLQNAKKRRKTIGMIVLAILVHALFNTALQTTHMGFVLLIIISGYLFITWLIYKSERVYITNAL